MGLASGSAAGSYTLAATSPASLTSELDQLTFTPPALGLAISATSTITLDAINEIGTTAGSTQVSETSVGTGSAPGNASFPVYRFFDTTNGTHLFTQSLQEAQAIQSTRPDLTEETNNFGAVASSNPSSASVYRFFEQGNGTHFFTASHQEFLGLTTPGSATYRSDFTYERSSSFYEDAAQQSGDVPIYRLFDSAHGTQFLTGSQAEYTSLTTPGSSTYRADLASEGIAFFSPTGSFLA